MNDYPVALNGRDAEGRVIYANRDGTAYVELQRGEAPDAGPPMPPGPSWFVAYPRRAVPMPEHMQDPAFLQHPGAELWASADGQKCVYLYRQGNPPMPAQPTLAPACAAAFAAAYRAGKPRAQ